MISAQFAIYAPTLCLAAIVVILGCIAWAVIGAGWDWWRERKGRAV